MTKVPHGAVALAFVLLLCTLTVVAAAGNAAISDGQDTIVSNANSTNHLSPPSSDVSGQAYQRVSMDVSSSVTVAAQEIHNEHDSQTLDRNFHSRDEQTQRDTAQEQLDTIHDRLESLDRRQRQLLNQYSEGGISSQRLVRELIVIQVAIDAQSELLERTMQRAEPSDEFRVRLETLRDAISIEQPVVDRLQDVLADGDDPTTVYVQTAEDSLVLAMVDEDVHLRQATLLTERNVTGEDQFGDDFSPGGYSEAQKRMEALYPWAYSLPNLNIGGDTLSVYSQIYQLGLDHPHGALTAYFDGATTNIFHENQRLSLRAVPTETTLTNTTDERRLTVHTTRETGPMNVTVSADGSAVAGATVEIDGQIVGTTDGEGSLWTVQPMDGFEIAVTTPDGTRLTADYPAES